MLTISPAGPSTQVQDCGETGYHNPQVGFGDAALAWHGPEAYGSRRSPIIASVRLFVLC
jgi:hypothetical protein